MASVERNQLKPNSDDLHAESKITEVPISKLRVDMSYQRTPNQDFIDELAREWDVIKTELILVSDRGERPDDGSIEGGYFIVSGQHRVRAAHKLGLQRITARVIDLSKVEDPGAIEAHYRRGTNRSIGDRSMDVFKAKVREGDEDAVGLVALLRSHKTEINFGDAQLDSGINAVSACEQVYARDQGSVLNETLETIRIAWGEINPRNTSANMIKAISWFIASHGLETDRGRFVEKISQFTPVQLVSRANQMQAMMGKSKWLNLYFVFVELYNEKLIDRNKLKVNTKLSGLAKNRTSGAG